MMGMSITCISTGAPQLHKGSAKDAAMETCLPLREDVPPREQMGRISHLHVSMESTLQAWQISPP